MRRNRLIFYAAWILSLVGISFFGGVVSYGVFCALTLVPVVMFIYLLFVLFSFRFYQQLGQKYVTCRTPVTYYFTLQNETAFAFARVRVSFYEFGADYGDLDKDEEYELLPYSGRTITTSIVCKYRGEYEIGVRKVIITDFLNLFRLTYKNREPLKVNISPAVEFPNGDMTVEQPLFSHHTIISAPETRDILVRPYIDGDPLRSINWKATAKSGRLMSASMTSEEHSSVHILLDTLRRSAEPEEYLPLEDELLTRLITLVLYFIDQRVSVEVYYSSSGQNNRIALRSMREFEEFYTAVSAIRFTSDVDIDMIKCDLLRSGMVPESDLIVLRSGEGSEEVAE